MLAKSWLTNENIVENCKSDKPQPASKHVLAVPPPKTKHILLISDTTYELEKCYRQTKQSDYSKAIKLVSDENSSGSEDGSAGGASCGNSVIVVIPLLPLIVMWAR